MTDYTELVNKEFTHIGSQCRLRGEFHFSGKTQISSTIEGEVHVDDKSELCLEHQSHVTGTIYCHNIEIYGKFEGTLKATGKVTIYAPAEVQGMIDANTLLIHPGAVLNIDGHTRLNS
ncbi:MAG: polymer-forming cytoskeletal protein [Bacteriovoracaceae bacterium]|nr:polymer-forming cytoskeletal protein [Bacteriovoracaceae bacterium]